MDQQREIWNAQNAQAIEQSNIEWRRQANTINTAAENAANATAAQQAYGLSSQELANTWQQLRDDAAYARTAFQNEEQRKTTLYATALANDPGAAGDTNYIDKLVGIADKIIDT
jgi:predicted chitinase